MKRSPRSVQPPAPCFLREWALRAIFLLSPIVSSTMVSSVMAQTPTATASSQTDGTRQIGDIERRLSDLTDTLAQTQAALQQSQAELIKLRKELDALRAQTNAGKADPDLKDSAAQLPASASDAAASSSSSTDNSVQSQIDSLKEQQDVLEAQVKQHEQTKIETASKYNLTFTGLALFNAYSNAGVVDNTELPTFALLRSPGASHGSAGATLRQTVLGIAASGPVIAGAQSSAYINVDFFGAAAASGYGYTTAGGSVRMRDARLGLAWNKSSLQVGYTVPLISPLSPTSFATVAQPALAGSGNLWTWSPQAQFQQDVSLHDDQGRLSFEAGVIYPQSPNYTSVQLDGPVEAGRRPGVEGRIAYRSGNSAAASPHSLALGVGAYTASQFYNSATQIHSWAVTGDWQVPLSRRLELSGEVYRGRALGGLGGGLYKDVFYGTDPITGRYRTTGVETAGGWSQLKLIVDSHWEANSMFGLDDAFSSSFYSVVLPASASTLTLTARNSTVAGNIVFRPRSSLIFSPEYRRIMTWQYSGAPYVANIFTLSAGYKF